MQREHLSSLIADESDSIIYLSDPETYDLLYLNQTARELFGLPRDADLTGLKCYQAIQGRQSPCEFCTTPLLSRRRFYVWEHYNQNLGRRFLLRDKLIEADGKMIRMEITTDVSEERRLDKTLADKFTVTVEEALVGCINTLKNGKDVGTAINSLLYHVGHFYKAERAYIFEIDYEGQVINNTYEWCGGGVEPQIKNLQQAPLKSAERWLEAFEKTGHIAIPQPDKTADHSSLEYQILESQGIKRLIAAPLLDEAGGIMGFIGVDNPADNLDSTQLLSAISNFVVDNLGKRTMLAQLERMGYEDALTGLDNRMRYIERIQELQKAHNSSLGVVFLDINGLKSANEAYGHVYGDAIIIQAAENLRRVFSKDIYRIGGDEFVALCVDLRQEEFDALVEQLRQQTRKEQLGSVSIGAKWAGGDSSALDLVADADELMYIDKQSYYRSSLNRMPRHRALFTKDLTRAIKNGAYVVYLQPKVDLRRGRRICGAEALVRRREEDGSLTSPVKFISMLEAEGAIRHIDFFVLETVCQILSRWRREGCPLLQMSVNFSRITLLESEVVESMLQVCRSYGVDPKWITVEVTESIGSMDLGHLNALIEKMVEAGFSISLDDFGSQYSNLAILSSVDFDEVKFDKSMIQNICTNEKSKVIVRHAIGMAKTLNETHSVAEGIETEEQLRLLESMNCDYGQGYLFSKPVAVPEFEALVRAQNGDPEE